MTLDKLITDALGMYAHPWVIIWILIELLLIIFIIIAFKKFPKSGPVVLFDFAFEKVYEFFEEILWEWEKQLIKTYITILFFIILISNLFGVFLEFFLPIFGHGLEHYIKIPTADINFNLAMAIIWVVIMIIEQFKHLWLKHFAYDYFPVLWKGYIPYELGSLPKFIDYPLFLIIKTFDIIISLFLWVLEIVGHWAKLISLSFRLFGNVTSGGILLAMLVWAVSVLSVKLIGIEFPVIIPLIIYIQELLVALIQALVFPLLVAIFIKVAKVSE